MDRVAPVAAREVFDAHAARFCHPEFQAQQSKSPLRQATPEIARRRMSAAVTSDASTTSRPDRRKAKSARSARPPKARYERAVYAGRQDDPPVRAVERSKQRSAQI